MNYELTLTDGFTTATFDQAQMPVTTTPLEISADVQVLSGNLYTDFIAQKRIWSRSFAYLTIDEFNELKGFYDRQFTLFQYPLLTIVDDNAIDVPVRMSISAQNIIDNCATVADVTVSFRESKELGS